MAGKSETIPTPSNAGIDHSKKKKIRSLQKSADKWLKRKQRMEKWNRIAERFAYILVKRFHLRNPTIRWALYGLYMKLQYIRFKIINRIEVVGRENIPKTGAIFLINHIGNEDVPIFLSIMDRPVSTFIEVGAGAISKILERLFYHVTRVGHADEILNKIKNTIEKKNAFFAIWPEGTISRTGRFVEPFSGIAKVYRELNAERDRIPFVPVVMQGSECYSNHYKWIHKNKSRLPRPLKLLSGIFIPMKKIRVSFLPPVYIPREWLKDPKDGGKSPRELINYACMKIAGALGQKEFDKNPILEYRRNLLKKKNAGWH